MKDQLDTLAELLAKATPGVWREGNCDFYVDGSDGDDLVIGCVGHAGGFRSHEYSVERGRKSRVLDNNRAIVASMNFLRDNLPAIIEQQAEIERLRAANKVLRNGYADAVSGLEYILSVHGRLSGVGFDRVSDHFSQHVTIPEREGLLAGGHDLAALSPTGQPA